MCQAYSDYLGKKGLRKPSFLDRVNNGDKAVPASEDTNREKPQSQARLARKVLSK
jgi:hypothetical protein